jgi:hypothetical protein
MKKSESIIELGTALALAQAEMSNPAKNAKNPFFKSSYADLAEVINISKPTLAKFGLSIIQMPYAKGAYVGVETTIIHKSGEYISSRLNMPLGGKKDAQAVGSSITYARRYALAGMCGIAQEDDDGNSATKTPTPTQKKNMAINKAMDKLDEAKKNADIETATQIYEWAEDNDYVQVIDKHIKLFGE